MEDFDRVLIFDECTEKDMVMISICGINLDIVPEPGSGDEGEEFSTIYCLLVGHMIDGFGDDSCSHDEYFHTLLLCPGWDGCYERVGVCADIKKDGSTFQSPTMMELKLV